MSVNSLRKFKISISEESRKVQGLQVGDVVRRQYFDGKNVIYSLMLVISSGIDEIVDDTGEIASRPYFIGNLLEGDAPETDQILDFVRVTSLFNEDRLGALYLTASDEEAPYMDIIDGIGKNRSISWPSDIRNGEYEALDGYSNLEYRGSDGIRKRVLSVTSDTTENPIGLKINFTRYVVNPDRVIVSYWVRKTAGSDVTLIGSLEYADGTKTDGSEMYVATDGWAYRTHVFTVDYSGRHKRAFKLTSPSAGSFEVSDFNVILLSSISNFSDAAQIRWGKLDGIVDPIYGRLHGYGGYARRLFVSGSASVSGTLTAGDENGFGATFYAGKIHRNHFINSLSPAFTSARQEVDAEIKNPTGIGDVFKTGGDLVMNVQTRVWTRQNKRKLFTLSFWAYAKAPCSISVYQDGLEEKVGSVVFEDRDLVTWKRCSLTFTVATNPVLSSAYQIRLSPVFGKTLDTTLVSEEIIYFSAPQLEPGDEATPYQATDDVLEDTEDYGAWLSRGGIGGTIQNPLLKLNYDGEGGIATRTDSVSIKADGSGHLAGGNIKWSKDGNVEFGEGVSLGWGNLSDDAKDSIRAKSISIIGDDTMLVIKGAVAGQDSYQPQQLDLKAECFAFDAASATFQWQYYSDGIWADISKATKQSLSILPSSKLWNVNDNAVTIRCVAVIGVQTCYASINIKKMFVDGFSVEITSSKGLSFKNGTCQTVLTANVYFRGELVTDLKVLEGLAFTWRKYRLPDTENEVKDWWEKAGIDRTSQSIVLDYTLDGQDFYTCSVATTNMFTYTFPITF